VSVFIYRSLSAGLRLRAGATTTDDDDDDDVNSNSRCAPPLPPRFGELTTFEGRVSAHFCRATIGFCHVISIRYHNRSRQRVGDHHILSDILSDTFYATRPHGGRLTERTN